MCHTLEVATQRIVHFTVGARVIWALLFLGKSNIKDLVVMELQSFTGALVAVIDIWIKKVYLDARVVFNVKGHRKRRGFLNFPFHIIFWYSSSKALSIIRNLSNLREMNSLFSIKSSEV